jgi:hypothetical protein
MVSLCNEAVSGPLHHPLQQAISLISYYIAVNGKMIHERWNGKDLEGHGHGLNWGTILALAWMDWSKPLKASVRTAGVLAEIQTLLKHYCCSNKLNAGSRFGTVVMSLMKTVMGGERQFLNQLDDWHLPKITLHYELNYKDKHLWH